MRLASASDSKIACSRPSLTVRPRVVTQQKADRAYRYAPSQSREEMTAALMLDALSAAPDGVRDAALAQFVGRIDPSVLAAAIEAARRESAAGS